MTHEAIRSWFKSHLPQAMQDMGDDEEFRSIATLVEIAIVDHFKTVLQRVRMQRKGGMTPSDMIWTQEMGRIVSSFDCKDPMLKLVDQITKRLTEASVESEQKMFADILKALEESTNPKHDHLAETFKLYVKNYGA